MIEPLELPRSSPLSVGHRCGAWLLALGMGDCAFGCERRERARSFGVVLTERVDTWGLTVWDLVALGRAPHTRWSGRLLEEDRADQFERLDLEITPRRHSAAVVAGDRVLVIGGNRRSSGPATTIIEALELEDLRSDAAR